MKQRHRIRNAVFLLLRRACKTGRYRWASPIGSGLDDLAGSWTVEEEHEFLAATEPLSQVDDDLWR